MFVCVHICVCACLCACVCVCVCVRSVLLHVPELSVPAWLQGARGGVPATAASVARLLHLSRASSAPLRAAQQHTAGVAHGHLEGYAWLGLLALAHLAAKYNQSPSKQATLPACHPITYPPRNNANNHSTANTAPNRTELLHHRPTHPTPRTTMHHHICRTTPQHKPQHTAQHSTARGTAQHC